MDKKIGLAIGIGVLALVLRLPGLGQFMTADEPNWMIRSAEFYHKLFLQHDPGGTFITSHPGATAMWLIGAGEFIQEKRLGFAVDEGTLAHFRLAATLPIALATSLLIGIAAWQIARLRGAGAALAAGVLLAADPYLTGMSQIAHLDALLALFMLNAILAFFLFARARGVLCGIFTGLALATKFLLAGWLLVFFALVLLTKKNFRQFFFIAGVATVTLYFAWPALWIKADINDTLARDIPAVVQDEHSINSATEPISPATFYVRTMLGRTTPWVLVLTGVGILIMYRTAIDRQLILYALGYLILISLAAKKADRYALPALVMLPVLAGYGVRLAGRGFSQGWRGSKFTALLITLLLVLHTFFLSPYAISYNNPLFPNIRPLHQQGWGEGLEAAAAWLNQHPLGEKLTIASWYPNVIGPYFQGKTFSPSSIDDARVGYVVTYRNMGGRGEDDQATAVLKQFAAAAPEHVISLAGVPYVWIYNTIGLPYFDRRTEEIFAARSVGQTVIIEKNNWSQIDIGLATFSSRPNTHDVILHIKQNPHDDRDVRTVTINASQIIDSDWNRFTFEPIPDSAGQTFYIELISPTGEPGDAIAARWANSDIRPGQLFLNGQPRQADIAYRVP